MLGLTFMLLGLVTDSMWALAAGSAGETLRKSRRWARVQRYVSGSVFVGLGVVTALTGSHRSRTAALARSGDGAVQAVSSRSVSLGGSMTAVASRVRLAS